MELFAQYTGWMNYAAVQLAEAEVQETQAEALVRYLEAQALVLTGTLKGTVTKAKAEITVDPEVKEARAVVIQAYAQRKMTQVIFGNCERCTFVVSRELSRRIGSSGAERRNMRWNP